MYRVVVLTNLDTDIYSWSRHTPLDRVKVVILGQDPYHNANQAHGLCFSVRPPTPAPPSLKNIFACLKKDYPEFTEPKSGYDQIIYSYRTRLIVRLLTPWADRGVLLLNTCLTVRAHNANSHAGQGWEEFTSQALRAVSKSSKGIVFLAWGTPAQKRIDSIGIDKNKHCILRTVHPSPLSAARGFFDCKHFVKANEWLRNRYGVEGEVEWDCLAEGKQGRGLPPKEFAHKPDAEASISRSVVASKMTETSNGDSDVRKSGERENNALVGSQDRTVATGNDDEFDDDELDNILSSQ